MIGIKDQYVLRDLLSVPTEETLLDILFWLDLQVPGKVIITSGPRKDDDGVHGTNPSRGIDIRSWVFRSPEQVVGMINAEWEYDYERFDKQIAKYHRTETGAFHIHLQSHKNTRRRLHGSDTNAWLRQIRD